GRDRAGGAGGVRGGGGLGDAAGVGAEGGEHGLGDVGPRSGLPGAGEVVGAVGGAGGQQVGGAGGQVGGVGEPADLVGDHVRADAPGGQVGHGGHEVGSVADHPGGADQVVGRQDGHGQVPGGLGRPVHRQRGRWGVLVVGLGGAVEDVVGGVVHQGEPVGRPGPGQRGDAGGVDRPRLPPALGGLGGIDTGVRGGVDD